MGFDEHAGRQPEQGVGVREDPDDVGAPLEFLVDSFDMGLVDQILAQWACGKSANAVRSALASRSMAATAGSFTARVSATVSSWSRTASGVGWANTTPQHLLAVEDEINNRPRLVLADRTPAPTTPC